MRNKLTLIVLVIAACTIWTYISIKLFSPQHMKTDTMEVAAIMSDSKKFELESLSLSPFIDPEDSNTDSSLKGETIKPASKAKNKALRGRFIGIIEADGASQTIVEIDKIYHYVSGIEPHGDCRLLKMYGNDSVCVLYSGDTLMLYNKYGR